MQHNIEEYSLRVGQQACVVVACPGSKHQNNFRAFGAKPLEDVVKNLRSHIMTELEASLARQAPPEIKEDPSLHELPPLVVDGIPTPESERLTLKSDCDFGVYSNYCTAVRLQCKVDCLPEQNRDKRSHSHNPVKLERSQAQEQD